MTLLLNLKKYKTSNEDPKDTIAPKLCRTIKYLSYLFHLTYYKTEKNSPEVGRRREQNYPQAHAHTQTNTNTHSYTHKPLFSSITQWQQLCP